MQPIELVAIILVVSLTVANTLIILGIVPALVRLQRRLDALGAPTEDTGATDVPQFSAVDLGGNLISNATLSQGLTALLFVSPTCRSCKTTLAETTALRHKAKGGVIVVCEAATGACAELARDFGIDRGVIADASGELMKLFAVDSLPSAVLIAGGTRMRSRGYPLREELEAVVAGA